MGSQVPPSTVYRQSLLSSYHYWHRQNRFILISCTNNIHRFDTWPVEVSVTYTISMASIIIYGRSSHIQKLALEGASADGYGLKQLSSYDGKKFCPQVEYNNKIDECLTFDSLFSSGINNSSWAIRHCALLGLSRVVQICKKQTAKDGFSSVAWSKLVERVCGNRQTCARSQKLQQVF